jgi:hypothetical protein
LVAVERAKQNGDEWVETTKDVMEHICTNMGGKNYFIFRGVKVCETGQADKIQEQMDRSLYQNERSDFNPGRVE